jgi:hypothetical protein
MNLPATGRRAEWTGFGKYTPSGGGAITDGWFAEDIRGMLLALDAIALAA